MPSARLGAPANLRTHTSRRKALGDDLHNTGNAWKSQKNQAGVTTTQTSKSGEARTMNGKGVYRGPNGEKCYRTAASHGCN
jgi:hypothetical protein